VLTHTPCATRRDIGGLSVANMEIATSFADLTEMHPELEWQEIAAAAVAVLEDCRLEAPFSFPLEMIDLPGFGTEQVRFLIDRVGVSAQRVAKVRRTYEAHRRVELAAIAVAALGLYHGGGHQIVDVSARGSGADYLVDSSRDLLEIAGRSRHRDLEAAWVQRVQRLTERGAGGFYLCVLELEGPSGRLAFLR